MVFLESLCIDYIEGRRKDPVGKGLLSTAGFLFKQLCRLRHFLYDTRILKTRKLPCPVISIGNIVAGGTGKTPFVRMLANVLSRRGKIPAILSRGYRSAGEKRVVFVSEGNGPLESAEVAGDEPYWLAANTKAMVFTCKDRFRGGIAAVKKGASIILLEDGMQHRRLERDVEIVLLDATDPFGKGFFLPRGYLRDLPGRLRTADWIVVTRLDEGVDRDRLLREIRQKSDAPVIGFASLYSLEGGRDPAGMKVGAFCGIAKPKFFYGALERLGAEIVSVLSSPDHRLPGKKELDRFAADCRRKGAEALVCTEKDLVKLGSSKILDLPVFVVTMDYQCVWNEHLWHALCQSISR